MRDNFMVGLCAHCDNPNWQLIRNMGTKWVRLGVPYPWEDRVSGAYAPGFLRAVGEITAWRRQGFEVLCSTPALGSTRFNPEVGDTVWHSGYPAWMGSPADEDFYPALEAGISEICAMTKHLVTWYQLGNEPDFQVFIGPTTYEQNVRFNTVWVNTMKACYPGSKVGINLAGVAGDGTITDYAVNLTRKLYRELALPYDYLGLDGYFGCWQPGGPANWIPYMDTMAQISGKPLIINEWGYGTNYEAPFERDFDRKGFYNNINCKQKRWNNMWEGRPHTPELQADYIRQCYALFADHPACLGAFFFRWGDSERCWQCGEKDCPTETHWGVVDVDQNPKPGYYGYQSIIRELFN